MAKDLAKAFDTSFFDKKMNKAVRTRDVDKDGNITQADFLLILQRYEEQNISTPEHRKLFAKIIMESIKNFGLQDKTVKFSYEEFKVRLVKFNLEVPEEKKKTLFEQMFILQARLDRYP